MVYFDNIEKLVDKVDFNIEIFFDTFEQILQFGLNWILADAISILGKIFSVS